jgi:hypothetical protein
MPDRKNDIISFWIKIDNMRAFEVIASEQPQASPAGGYARTGMNDSADTAFLKEVLGKIIAAYPGDPVSLCIDGPAIFPDSHCAQTGDQPKASQRSTPSL